MAGGEGKEINITLEVLFDIQRAEKNRVELQRLPKNFFKDLAKYLQEKKILAEGNYQTGLFAAEEKEKASAQLKNIKKILAELYAKREKKIIELALDSSNLGSAADTASLLDEERMLFDRLVDIFGHYRKGILSRIVAGELPALEEKTKAEGIREEQRAEKRMAESAISLPALSPAPLLSEVKADEGGELKIRDAGEPNEWQGAKMVRFIYAVPEFIGKELERYGPFEEEDITTLPAEIADILITKGRAEEIRGQQQ